MYVVGAEGHRCVMDHVYANYPCNVSYMVSCELLDCYEDFIEEEVMWEWVFNCRGKSLLLSLLL